MKKIVHSILATIVAASGFSAFGQDWITVDDPKRGIVQDDFSTPGPPTAAYSGEVTVEVLWAKTGIADPYTESTEVTDSFTLETEITDLLANGWNLAQNYSSGAGTAPMGLVTTTAFGATATTKGAGGVAAYNSGSPFEFNIRDLYGGGASGDSGDDIQMIYIAMAPTTSYLDGALGMSDPFLNEVGSSATDPNSNFVQSGDTDEVTGGMTGPARFFVVQDIPEPTTLKLAGLGGFSMLFFRRRKAYFVLY